MARQNQRTQILELLQTEGRVSTNRLCNISFRFGGRIHELRNQGYIIKPERDDTGKRWYVYYGHITDEALDLALL